MVASHRLTVGAWIDGRTPVRRDITPFMDVLSAMALPTSTSPAPGRDPTSQISSVRFRVLFAAAAAAGITVTLVLALAMGAAPSAGPASAGTSPLSSASGADGSIATASPGR